MNMQLKIIYSRIQICKNDQALFAWQSVPDFLIFLVSTCGPSSWDEGIRHAVIICRNVSFILKPKGRAPSGLLFTAFSVHCCMCISVQLATAFPHGWMPQMMSVWIYMTRESSNCYKGTSRDSGLLHCWKHTPLRTSWDSLLFLSAGGDLGHCHSFLTVGKKISSRQ